MKILKELFLIIISILILFLLVSISINLNENQIKNLDTKNYENIEEYVKKTNNKIEKKNLNELTEVIGENIEEKIIKKDNNIEIKPGIYIFNAFDIENKINFASTGFNIKNKGPGSFFINNINENQVIIYSINTLLDLELIDIKTNKKQTNILIYPNSYIRFSIKRNSSALNADLLKISKLFTLGFTNKKVIDFSNMEFIENNKKTILYTLSNRNRQSGETIKKLFSYYIWDKKDITNKFKKYLGQSFYEVPASELIGKYMDIFLNKQKKKIYYKNKILKNLIRLLNSDKNDVSITNTILEYSNNIKNIDNNEYKNIEEIINLFYKNSLKSNETKLITINNLNNLFLKFKNQNKQNESLIFLKNIFDKYHNIKNNNIYSEISLFKEKHLSGLKIKGKNTDKQNLNEIQYLLNFLEKLIISDFEKKGEFLKEITIIFRDYIDISIEFEENKKEALYKNEIIVKNVLSIIKNYYFEEERKQDLLVRKTNYNLDKNTIKVLKNNIEKIKEFFYKNKKILNEENSLEKNIISNYKKYFDIFKEYFQALDDYEKYKLEYDKVRKNLLSKDAIDLNLDNNKLNVKKAYDYIKTFNGIDTSNLSIKVKEYIYCLDPESESKEESPNYCYEIKNLNINGKIIDFLLFPFEQNKIDFISLHSKKTKQNYKWEAGNFKLDEVKETLALKIKSVSKIEEKEKYDFRNFFINTYTKIDQNSYEEYDGNINTNLEEDKVIREFKRSKLLSENGDFGVLKDILKIKYNDLIVERVNDKYNINILKGSFNINTNINNKTKNWRGYISSEYNFSPNHSFKNLKIKILDDNYIEEEIFLYGGNSILIKQDLKIKDFKKTLEEIFEKIEIEKKGFDLEKRNIEYNLINKEFK